MLKLQSEVASAVAGEIRTRVTAEERKLASARRVNLMPARLTCSGRYHLRRQNEQILNSPLVTSSTPFSLIQVMHHPGQDFPVAWLQRGIWGAMSFRQVKLPRAEATLRALELDSSSAEAYTSLAMVKHRYEWDWAGAERDFRRSWSSIRVTSRRTDSLLSC